jgi:hypothetical protein
MGANEDDIKDLIFEALKTESSEYNPQEYQPRIEFAEKELPEGSMLLSEWANIGGEEIDNFLLPVFQYLIDRGFDPISEDFFWSPSPGYENRVIIPFRYQGRIVGNTARKITEGKPKYLSDQHPHFVFNFDKQSENQKYLFVVEGPFDALNIDGVALLTNEISDQQARIINSIGTNVIVIPDQDRAGLNLINKAAELGWSVAFPNWEDDIKDVSDAVRRYGKLFVVVDAIKTAVSGQIKINIEKNKMIQRLSRNEDE